MAEITLNETFKINGIAIDVSSVVLRDPSGLFGVKRDDTDEVIVPAGTAMIKVDIGSYTYTFDEPAGEDGLTYTYWVEWQYQGSTYRDERQVTGSTDTTARDYSTYLTWIKNEFKPRTLATPDDTIKQMFENAVRYWNTHSAYKISTVYEYSPGAERIQLSNEFKTVVDVIPTSATEYIWNTHPLWTLTGITILDNITTDLIMMSEAFRNYRVYVGTNFRWHWEKSDDPNVGGYLYVVNVPSGVGSLYVVGTKRILANEEISTEVILNWILYYTKALVKQVEGHALRAAGIIDVSTDGQALVDEGREEQMELQEKLKKESWWVCFPKRM